MAIALRSKKDIEGLKAANKLVAQTLDLIRSSVTVGSTTNQMATVAEEFIVSNGGRCSFKGLYTPPFPGAICTSVNEVIIQGIPDDVPLKEGDIVGFDVGVELNGWYGDAAITVPIGKVAEKDEDLISAAKSVLLNSIKEIKSGMRFKELSAILEDGIVSSGFVPLRGYCGHGIGRLPHEEPSILNYVEGRKDQGPKIKDGMVFCIEPMLCQKSGESKLLADRWSVVSVDGLNGSHYEHTVAIVGGKAEILTIT